MVYEDRRVIVGVVTSSGVVRSVLWKRIVKEDVIETKLLNPSGIILRIFSYNEHSYYTIW